MRLRRLYRSISRLRGRIGLLLLLAAGLALYGFVFSSWNNINFSNTLDRFKKRARPVGAFAGGFEDFAAIDVFGAAAVVARKKPAPRGSSPAKTRAPVKNELVVGTKPIAIAMGFNLKTAPHLIPVAQRSVQNKELYARLHGYSFVLDPPHEINTDRPPAWHKVLEQRRSLDHFEWACWFDVDTVIANLNVTIESLIGNGKRELVIARARIPAELRRDTDTSKEDLQLNSGVYCIKSTEWSRTFLDRVYAEEKLIHHANWEQRAMQVLLRDNPAWVADHVLYRDEHEMNIHNWGYRPGDFVVHFYGWNCQPKKCEVDIRERLDAILEEWKQTRPAEVAASVAGLNLIAQTYPEQTLEELRKEAAERERQERERREQEEAAKRRQSGEAPQGGRGAGRAEAGPAAAAAGRGRAGKQAAAQGDAGGGGEAAAGRSRVLPSNAAAVL